MGSHAGPKRGFAPLADSYQIVTFDARGCGRSEGKPPYSHAQYVADLDALREHLGFETFVLTGGSYGGFIALEYALAHPDRVSHLILRDTSSSNLHHESAKANALARAGEFPDINAADLDRIFAGRMENDDDFRTTYAAIAPLYAVDYDPEKVAAEVAAITFRAETHNAAFSQNIPDYDLTGRLGEIHIPTLVIVGRHDWITPVAASEEIAGGISGAELVIFEHSGHAPQHEENERFIGVVRDFLRRRGG
jgi:proline iminopeptidase